MILHLNPSSQHGSKKSIISVIKGIIIMEVVVYEKIFEALNTVVWGVGRKHRLLGWKVFQY